MERVATNALPATRSRAGQSLVGLSLAAMVFVGWAALHVFALFVFELSWSTAWAVPLLFAGLCWLSVGLFIVSHDAMHGSLAPGHPRINATIGATLLFVYAGFGWRKMRAAHFDHHRHAGSERDPDFDADNPQAFWRWYATFLQRYFGWRSLLWVNLVVAVYWLVFGVPMLQLVLLYGAPAIASSIQLFYFGTFRPHRHGGAGFTDRHNARSDDFKPLASLASCFHFGYHLEHHRRPDVPWWGLPSVRRAMGGAEA